MWDTSLLLDIHILCERCSLRTKTARVVVGRGQRWMIFKGSSVEYWRETTPKSQSFFFLPGSKGISDSWRQSPYAVSTRPVALLKSFIWKLCKCHSSSPSMTSSFVQVPSRPHYQRDHPRKDVRVHAVCQSAVSPRNLRGSLTFPLLVPLQRGLPWAPLRGDTGHVP